MSHAPTPKALQKGALIEERLQMVAYFGAMCLFFATLENLIPRPVVFFRLGLANLPILLAFPLFRPREIVLLTLLKVLGQALLNGTLASYVFLFSLAGSVASVVVMYAVWRLASRWISTIGISLLGAMASNAIQIALSIWFIFGSGAWIIAPVLMGLGLGTGLIIGLIAMLIADKSQWYKELISDKSRLPSPRQPAGNPEKTAELQRKRRRWRAPPHWDILGRQIAPATLFWLGIAILPAFLFQESLLIRLGQVLLFSLLAVMAGKRVSFGYFLGLALSIVIFNVIVPFGRVYFEVLGFPITELAVMGGISKALGIVGLVMISLATIRPNLRLPGSLGGLIGRMFSYYENILAQRQGFDPRQPIASVDRILFSLGNDPAGTATSPNSHGTSFAGYFLIAIVLISQWSLLFVKISV